jgi:uncharacterized protein (TIGR02996 family)
MNEEPGFLAAPAANPTDVVTRSAYADWLDERGHPGADYLRTEMALARAAGDEARALRRKLIELTLRLPSGWRNRLEQPDLLLAPPVPFAQGWYFERDVAPRPYRSLPNLDPDMLSPSMPWLPGEDIRQLLDQRGERAALAEVERRAERLGLLLPPGFVSFAHDFRRRGTVRGRGSYCEFYLHVSESFQKVGDGYLIVFFAHMNYGNPHQLSWALYLVPGIAWHCVVVVELGDDDRHLLPDDPKVIYYCAPSFQTFLYRWWLAGNRRT